MKKETVMSERFVGLLYLVLTAWWVWMSLTAGIDAPQRLFFGAVYGTSVTLIGSFLGFSLAGRWGGWKSLLGRSMAVLSFGFLAQFLGQIVFSYYNIVLGVDVPYPSLADVGYFGSIPLYIYGMLLLARASGVRISMLAAREHVLALLIPVGLLSVSSFFFLRGYVVDWSAPLTVFLDFGYPLGQAFYVSIALLTYVVSRNTLGGLLRQNILLFIFAFFAQYVADFNFLYQNVNGTWYNGGYGDYLYLVAYVLMAHAFIQCGRAYNALRSEA